MSWFDRPVWMPTDSPGLWTTRGGLAPLSIDGWEQVLVVYLVMWVVALGWMWLTGGKR